MGVRIEVVDMDSAAAAESRYALLLEQLQELHPLHDSRFDRWLSTPGCGPGWVRLVATRHDCFVGFLAGRPSHGHIALVGSLELRAGVGSALIREFAERAAIAGAVELTIVLDSQREGRWERRMFFEANGFGPVRGSALHFARLLR
ncbi:hypothetical protein ACWDYH_31120 [Nocardia goodfellowii]